MVAKKTTDPHVCHKCLSPRKKTRMELLRKKFHEDPEFIRLRREELLGLGDELEELYNVAAAAGREPSEKIGKLILWARQEASVLNDPEYDPDWFCTECGLGALEREPQLPTEEPQHS